MPVHSGKMIKITPNNNIIRFGGSTRFYILGSPDKDDEDTYQVEDYKDEQDEKETNTLDEQTDYGCSWGIGGEDACEDDGEENNNADSNALKSIIAALKTGKSLVSSGHTSKKTSFSDNPYKSLQQWFVQEGFDFDCKVNECLKKFKCSIELPIEGEYFTVDSDQFSKVI